MLILQGMFVANDANSEASSRESLKSLKTMVSILLGLKVDLWPVESMEKVD